MKLPLIWLFSTIVNWVMFFKIFFPFPIAKYCYFSFVDSLSKLIQVHCFEYQSVSWWFSKCMTSLFFPCLLWSSHTWLPIYVTLLKQHVLILILPDPLLHFSKWHHESPSFSDQRSKSNPLFISFLTSTSVNPIDCLQSESFVPICTAATLIYLPPSLILISIKSTETSPVAPLVKNPPTNAGYAIPGLGRSPGVVNGNLLQYSCLENFVDRGPWLATVHGVTKSQTRLSACTHTCAPLLLKILEASAKFE